MRLRDWILLALVLGWAIAALFLHRRRRKRGGGCCGCEEGCCGNCESCAASGGCAHRH